MLHAPLVEDADSQYQHRLHKRKTLSIIFQYIISDIQKRPRSFKIGLFTIYLVVTFLVLLESAAQLSPVIFLQLSETQAGDSDLIFTPQAAINRSNTYEKQSNFLNTTEMLEYFNKMPYVFGVSPRWVLIGSLINNNTQVEKINQNLRTLIIILDQAQEISIGLGRRSSQNYISGNQVQISSTTLRGLNASIGDTLQVNLDFDQLLSGSGTDFFYNLIDSTLNPILKSIFGEGFEDEEYQSQDIQQEVNNLIYQADLLEQNQDLKEEAKLYLQSYISDLNTTDQQKELLLYFIDVEFARNMSQDARTLERFAYKLNDTITIRQIEMGYSTLLAKSSNFTFDVVVQESVESSKGKWQDGFCALLLDKENATNILMEGFLTEFEQLVIDSRLHDNSILGAIAEIIPIQLTKQYLWNQTEKINISEYALTENVVIKNRVQSYTTTDSIKNMIIDVSNNYFELAELTYPTSITATLSTSVEGYIMLKNFIDNLIVAATMILLMLSILLIYSLMIGDVDEKTYEFGMLRALGFQKSWLIILLLIQGLIFAIPGLALGLLTCYLLNSFVSLLIFSTTDLISSYEIATQALYLAFCLGLFIPLLSNIMPIQRALSKTLRDSLDIYHRTINEIFVTVVRLEKMGLSVSQTFSSLLLVSIGFISYYLIPMAFIFNNITLAMSIINIIFIILTIGLMLLINLFEIPIEKGLLKIILMICKFDKNLYQIIKKNMAGHQNRNWKTTFMYSLCLSFILFAGASLTLDTKMIGDVIQSTLGADVTIIVLPTDTIGLDEYALREHLEQEKSKDSNLIDIYTFNAIALNHFPYLNNYQWISTLSTFPWRRIKLAGVELNYLQACMQDYYLPNEYDTTINYPKLTSGKLDAVYGLYDRTGNLDIENEEDIKKITSQMGIRDSFYKDLNITRPYYTEFLDREINLILPEGYKQEVSIDVNTPSTIFWGRQFRIKVRHMATKFPGYTFSSYRAISSTGNGIISLEDQLYMINRYINGHFETGDIQWSFLKDYQSSLPKNLTYGLPKSGLKIKFKKQLSKQERVDFCNRLRNLLKDDQTLLYDVKTLKEDAENALFYIQILNIVVAVIALILSFFLILIAFVGNVKDNSWEFGVLRAIGLSKQQLTRIYIYEAICLITASGLLGTIIGIFLAIVLTLQILMFIELPFTLLFPTGTFLITCLGGLGTAIFASYFAVLDIRDKSISVILKGLSV